MKLTNRLYLSCLALSQTSLFAAAHPTQPAKLPLPTRLIHQFPDPTWIENIAVRSNGQLLITSLSSTKLQLIDPAKSSQNPVVIGTIPGAISLLGIAELEQDTFYVVAGNFSFTTVSTGFTGRGSYSIWQVALSQSDHHQYQDAKSSPTKIKKVTDIPEAAFLNGMTTIPGSPDLLLIADSTLGAVWQVNVKTGKYTIIISEPEMVDTSPAKLLGINGIKVKDSFLYFSNTNRELFARVKIDANGKATAKVEVLASKLSIDDFSLDHRGRAWLDENFSNELGVIDILHSNQTVVGGALNQLTFAGLAASAFGRQSSDRDILYVVTTGGLANPVNGTLTEGGKVVAVDTRGF